MVTLDGADRTIVGVVGDVHQRSLEAPTLFDVNLPMAQIESSYGEIVIRTSVDPLRRAAGGHVRRPRGAAGRAASRGEDDGRGGVPPRRRNGG